MDGEERSPAPGGARTGPGHPVPEFTAGALVRSAARILSAERGRVVIPAVVVFGISAATDTLLVELDRSLHNWAAVLVVALQAFSSLGLTFYAGLLDRLVGAVGDGAAAPGIRSVLLTLPYLRLVVADVLLYVLALVGTATFVLPGMILVTLFSIVGPLINMEDHGVTAAFRHSARLVRPHFWLVLLMVTLPLAIEHEVLAIVEDTVARSSALVLFGIEFAVAFVFGTTVGLVEVVIAEALMRRRRLRVLAAHETGQVSPAPLRGRPG